MKTMIAVYLMWIGIGCVLAIPPGISLLKYSDLIHLYVDSEPHPHIQHNAKSFGMPPSIS